MDTVHILERTLFLAVLFAVCHVAIAQPPEEEEIIPKVHPRIAAGPTLSTMGYGGNFIFQINPRVGIRAGYETLTFRYPFSFDENDISYDAEMNYHSGGFSLLADYYLFRSLYLSAGCAYNLFNPVITGMASDEWQYGDITIPPGKIGEFTFSVTPSLQFSPYLGLGLGRNTGLKKNLAFNVEIGAYYQGPPDIEIEASGLLAPTAEESHNQRERLEKQFSAYTFYPFVKMGLTLVLFKFHP